MGAMSEQTPEEGTDQTAADDTSGVEVPNITDNAVSGLDHEPLTQKRTTLVGRDTVVFSHDDGTTTTTETITDEVDTSPDDVDGGTVQPDPAPIEGQDSGSDTPIGDGAEQTTSGDGQSPGSDGDGTSEPGDSQPEQ